MAMSQQELLDEWKADCIINQDDIGYESLKCSSLHAKYSTEWLHYKNQLVRHEGKYAEMKKLRTRYYRGELTQQELTDNGWPQYYGPKLPKTETETFLSGDEELTALKSKMEACKNIIAFLEHVMKQLYSRPYGIRDFITDRQFKTGY